MRILHITNYYQEGFGYQENWLAFHQRKLGCDVSILSSDYYFPFPNYDSTMKNRLGDRYVGVGTFKDNDINIKRVKSYFGMSGTPGIIYFDITKSLLEFMPDIVHVHGATNLWIPKLLSLQKKYRFKVFIDSHQDYSVSRKKGGFIEKLYYSIWRIYYHGFGFGDRVNYFLPITMGAKKWLIDKLKIGESKIKVVPLGVDLDSMFYYERKSREFKKKHNLDKEIVVVNAGKQYKNKRIDWIIKVIEKSIQKNCNVFLVLIGDASIQYEEFLNRCLTAIDGHYLKLPFLKRDELRNVYSACDIGIWPGIPSNTIQEAMACKVALILPDNDIVGQLVDGNGLKEANDIDKAADFICNLYHNQKKLESFKNRSEVIAMKDSWKNIAEELLTIYKVL